MKLKKIVRIKTALLLLITSFSWASQVPDENSIFYNPTTGEIEIATQSNSDYESDNEDQAVPETKQKKKSIKLSSQSTQRLVPQS